MSMDTPWLIDINALSNYSVASSKQQFPISKQTSQGLLGSIVPNDDTYLHLLISLFSLFSLFSLLFSHHPFL